MAHQPAARPLPRRAAEFDAAGLNLFSYVYTIDDDMTDPEIDAVFRQMQALKVGLFCTEPDARDDGGAHGAVRAKYNIKPAWHPHEQLDHRSKSRPPTRSRSPRHVEGFVVNLDIGHFTAGNNDAVEFLKKHHDRISHLHIKDRSAITARTCSSARATRRSRNAWADSRQQVADLRDSRTRVPRPGHARRRDEWQMDYMKKALNA